MGLHGGRWTWKHPTTGAIYQEDVHDTTPSRVAAANLRAKTSLGTTGILSDTHGHGNSASSLGNFGDAALSVADGNVGL